MPGVFDYVNAISYSKKDLFNDDDGVLAQRDYIPFIVNRALSYHCDAILYANEMNQCPHVEKHLQFAFLLNTIRKARRFSKWAKRDDSDDVNIVSEYYQCSLQKAKQVIDVLKPEQLAMIRTKVIQGVRDDGATK